MKSGLEGRNNHHAYNVMDAETVVSMKSGLEGRNNTFLSGAVMHVMRTSQ